MIVVDGWETVPRSRHTVSMILSAFLVGMILTCTLIVPCYASTSESQTNVIAGRVIDNGTGRGIVGVRIEAYKGISVVSLGETDEHGTFRIENSGAFRCALYAIPWKGRQAISSIQYGPAAEEIDLDGRTVVNLTFRLFSVCSLIIQGDIDLVDLDASPISVNFTVLDVTPAGPLDSGAFLNKYGNQSAFLGFASDLVLIPTNQSVKVKVDCGRTILGRYGWINVTRSFFIDNIPEMQAGNSLRIDLPKFTSTYNINVTSLLSARLRERLREAEHFGFYVVAEKNDLSAINLLISSGDDKARNSYHEDSYAKLREAYLKANLLNERIDLVFSEAYWSAILFVFFLAFSAITLSFFFFDRIALKIVGFVFADFVILYWFYVIFPGCRLVQEGMFLRSSALAGGIAVFTILALPLTFGKIRGKQISNIALFSIAKRSLRRRKLRTVLVLTTVITLMLGFVALTSFSVEYGFRSGIRRAKTPSPGILLREANLDGDEFSPFASLDPTNLPWLTRREGVAVVAPRMESPPQLRIFEDVGPLPKVTRFELGTLTNPVSPGSALGFLGLVGISPSAESVVTHLDRLIIEGRFLVDHEQEGVVATREAAQAAGFNIGDRLTLSVGGYRTYVVLVGLIDDVELGKSTDLDGESILPRIRYRSVDQGKILRDEITYCSPADVLFVSFPLARSLPGMALSRICLSLSDPSRTADLARELVYARDYWVWIAGINEVQWMRLGSYVETKGWLLTIPLALVVLNMSVTMFTVVRERQREIFTLSSLGVSPASIAQLFITEALVIGLIGVGIGYLVGLSFYRVLTFLSIGLEVREKVEVAWSIAAAMLAVAVTTIGALLPSKQASLISTPLGLMRWKLTKQVKSAGRALKTPTRMDSQWTIPIPMKLQPGEDDEFMTFIQDRFSSLSDADSDHIERIVRRDEAVEGWIEKRLEFRHIFRDSSSFGFFISNCALTIKGSNKGPLNVELYVDGTEERESLVYITANLLRRLALEWSAKKDR